MGGGSQIPWTKDMLWTRVSPGSAISKVSGLVQFDSAYRNYLLVVVFFFFLLFLQDFL